MERDKEQEVKQEPQDEGNELNRITQKVKEILGAMEYVKLLTALIAWKNAEVSSLQKEIEELKSNAINELQDILDIKNNPYCENKSYEFLIRERIKVLKARASGGIWHN